MALSDLMMFDGMAPLKAFEAGKQSGLARLAVEDKQKLGQVLAAGDYKQGAKSAYGMGMLEEGSALARLAAQEQEMAFKQQQDQQTSTALAQLMGPQYSGLTPTPEGRRLATQLYSADQANNFRVSQANKPNLPQGWTFDETAGKAVPIPGFDPNAGKEPKAPRTQVVDVDGKRMLMNLDTGEAIKTLGTAPARSVKANNDQNNAAGFFDRMSASEKVIANPSFMAAGQDKYNIIGGDVPVIGNYLVSPEYQQFDQARRDFINAQLRKESGAAIGKEEFDNANKQYFPQPGDSELVLKQKARNRAIAINAMKRTAGPALEGGTAAPDGDQSGYLGADGITDQDIGGLTDGGPQFPEEAVQMLAQDPSPEMRKYFDDTFGEGASVRILGE